MAAPQTHAPTLRPATAPAGSTGPADGELVSRVVGGDRPAFDALVRRYQRQAVAVSYRLLGNTSDAQEVVQDAFLKAYKNLDTLEKPDAFGGWLMRIVSNLSLNFRRGRKVRQAGALEDVMEANGGSAEAAVEGGPTPAIDPYRALESRELGEQVRAALEELPEKQRLALILFTLQGLPQKDVAETLNCSVEAVKWHVFQGRKKLKDVLKDYL